jgi:hypothetical protein
MIRTTIIAAALVAASAAAAQSLFFDGRRGSVYVPFYAPPVQPLPRQDWSSVGGVLNGWRQYSVPNPLTSVPSPMIPGRNW